MRKIIKTIMTIVGFIGVLICAIWAMILRLNNPDMTEIRFFIEFPQVTIIGVICAVMALVGIEERKEKDKEQ